MSGFSHTYRDPDGCEVLIKPSADREHAAYFATSGDDFAVPSYRLAEVTRAMWAAAGQVVPDLPVIYDPLMVNDLAGAIRYALEGTSGKGSAEHENAARVLLSLGWRKP